jgi:hypothetical protein
MAGAPWHPKRMPLSNDRGDPIDHFDYEPDKERAPTTNSASPKTNVARDRWDRPVFAGAVSLLSNSLRLGSSFSTIF